MYNPKFPETEPAADEVSEEVEEGFAEKNGFIALDRNHYGVSTEVYIEGCWCEDYYAYYTGKPITPSVEVLYQSDYLTEGIDYTVSYKNNINAAPYDVVKAPTVIITGKGAYAGRIEGYFNIEPRQFSTWDTDFNVEVPVYKYTGKNVRPKPKITYLGKTLKEGTDYTLTPDGSDYSALGVHHYEIAFKGNFDGNDFLPFMSPGTVIFLPQKLL